MRTWGSKHTHKSGLILFGIVFKKSINLSILDERYIARARRIKSIVIDGGKKKREERVKNSFRTARYHQFTLFRKFQTVYCSGAFTIFPLFCIILFFYFLFVLLSPIRWYHTPLISVDVGFLCVAIATDCFVDISNFCQK